MNLTSRLERHLRDKTTLGQELLALPSVISYPREYRLGKESVYPMCGYGHKSDELAALEYLDTTGVCPICEAIFERMYEYGGGITEENSMDLTGEEWGDQ